ncbi:MAG: hypothetical protein WBH43_03165 [Aquiluna sp.]
MSERPAEETAVTKPTVALGLGYPNHRLEDSSEPIGWNAAGQDEIDHVSRETSTGGSDD